MSCQACQRNMEKNNASASAVKFISAILCFFQEINKSSPHLLVSELTCYTEALI